MVLYEQPLNERTRHFLRLESFFSQAKFFLQGETPWENQACVASLIEILTFLERTDIRSELLKELDRNTLNLSRLSNTPTINNSRLETTLDALSAQVSKIQRMNGKLTQELKDNELLNSVRQRFAISAGTCGFDIPSYHFWLNQSNEYKKNTLSRWLGEFSAIQEGIELLLSLLRKSALFEPQVAQAGFFQKALDPQHPCQLVRIHLPAKTHAYPEMSGGKHRINIRFLHFSEQGRPKQITEPLSFEISCCVL